MARSAYQRRVDSERAARMGGEKISEYFNQERLTRPVLRGELLAVLTQLERNRGGKLRALVRALWRYLRAPVGGATPSTPDAPNGEPTETDG